MLGIESHQHRVFFSDGCVCFSCNMHMLWNQGMYSFFNAEKPNTVKGRYSPDCNQLPCGASAFLHKAKTKAINHRATKGFSPAPIHPKPWPNIFCPWLPICRLGERLAWLEKGKILPFLPSCPGSWPENSPFKRK